MELYNCTVSVRLCRVTTGRSRVYRRLYLQVLQPYGSHISETMPSGVLHQSFETLQLSSPAEHVIEVKLDRPKKLNAMNKVFWREIRQAFEGIGQDTQWRAAILSANGKIFTAVDRMHLYVGR